MVKPLETPPARRAAAHRRSPGRGNHAGDHGRRHGEQAGQVDATADVTSSQIFDNGTNVGIGNTAPAARLDVSGAAIVRGLLSLPATGTATATAGKNSQPMIFFASAFNSGSATAVRSRGKLFYRLLEQAVAVEPVPYRSLVKCCAEPEFRKPQDIGVTGVR